MTPSQLQEIAQAVTDEAEVDWDAVEASSEPEDREAVRQLRLVAAIGQAARQLAARWGPFEIRQQIAHGTFGTLFRAWDPKLEREVALKLLDEGTGTTTATGAIHEARLLATLEHPNIVPVYGADVHDGRVGIWMKYIHGKTLKDVLVEQGPFGAGEAALIGRDLCQALDAVHKQGLVHRDIKAQNVMREVGGRIVLMDFGAGDTVEAAHDASIKGSPAYLAPEVVLGGPPTFQSDIYSLGVLLYHLVSGELPVIADSWDALRDKHARGVQRPLADARPDLPPWFLHAVDRAIAVDPAQRPATTLELFTLLTGGAARARTAAATDAAVARPERAAPVLKRRWAIPAGLAALIVTALWTVLTPRESPSAGAGGRPMLVAILPFQNLSANAEVGYLANAVSLELTTMLGHVGAVNVVPWSFMRAIDPGGSMDAVATRTGADMIVEGSVQPHTGTDGRKRLQVRVQVYRASTGTLFWATVLDRELGEFFDLQADLAKQLARRVQVVLARREQLLIDRQRRVSPDAMELYLKGRLASESYTGDFNVPIELFRRSIAIEPDFAEAYAGLAECYALQHAYSGTAASDEALARVLDHAGKAIALDPTLPDAWATRAFAKLALAWDWTGAESDYLQARRLSPSSPTVAASYANYLIAMRRFDDAIAVSREAADRSPFSPVVVRKLAWAYYVARRYDESIAQLRKSLEIDPSYEPSLTLLARAYALKGLKQDAIQQMQAVRPGLDALRAQVYAVTGDGARAEETLAAIQAPSYPHARLRYQIAAAYAALGREAEATHWLHEALAARDSGMSLLAADPMFDRIRGSAGFAGVMNILQFP